MQLPAESDGFLAVSGLPTTSMSDSEASIVLIPILSSAWSSAINTLEGKASPSYSLPDRHTVPLHPIQAHTANG